MPSPLASAASQGNLDALLQLLPNSSPQDLDIKDESGSNPLTEAVKNGHVEAVKMLLEHGVDPTNASSHTNHPEILQLLAAATHESTPQQDTEQGVLGQPSVEESEKNYYPPPASYPYYPTLNSAPMPMPDGAVYYHPSPQVEPNVTGAPGNLPPPDIARFIPCRYFPACRYGSSCMFAHPQGQYFPGPLPAPTQYPAPYDPATQQPYSNYYPQPAYPSQGIPPVPVLPSSPPTLAQGARPLSEVPQNHYVPSGASVPFNPISPLVSPAFQAQSQPGSHVPLSNASHGTSTTISSKQPSPPSAAYPAVPSTAPGFSTTGPPVNGYVPPHTAPLMSSYPVPDLNKTAGEVHINGRPDSVAHNRRGSMRRGPFAGRKPPCLFFPAGKCKNGNDCRFPHILPDQNGGHFQGGRGGGPRVRTHLNGTLEDKFSSLSIRQSGDFPRFNSNDLRPRHNGNKGNINVGVTGPRRPPATKQRVPHADEFPVLGGSTTPPTKSTPAWSPGNPGVPTAAQVLSAPAPAKKDSTKEIITAIFRSQEVTQPNGEQNFVEDQKQLQSGTNLSPPLPTIVPAAGATGTPKEVSVSA